ncbi:MAG: polysaccharide biosynthesis/export family protein, partial [Candidatus Omnitrophota bacterium]
TIMRWEKAGKIKRSKRDWRGWRFYQKEDLDEIKGFFERAYEYDQEERLAAGLNKVFTSTVILLITVLTFSHAGVAGKAYAGTAFAKTTVTPGIKETADAIEVDLGALPTVQGPVSSLPIEQEVKYTLGPNDVIAITVRRHPEFSGEYTINSEGKIEYKFIGDLFISGMNKVELNKQLTEILSDFIVEPDVDIAIVAYLSKIFYVVGEVGMPGKFYMRGNTISIREALFQSGLPTHAAAMRRSRLITPDDAGKDNFKDVNVYKLLYEGDLKENFDMQPGEVLYVPATVMAKIIRVISPVTNVAGQATGTTGSARYAVGI